jgi:hypothetical protein
VVRVHGRAYTEDMRRYSLIAALLAGCLHTHHIAVDGAVLGRVVIYRNGVAFYERRATVENGRLAVHVPRDRVDDFLKSLTVVDPSTRKPLSVSIPRKEADDGSYLTMTLETPERRHADVLLTYVTEAPAWKPSYRVVVGDKGKVMLEGWAIVDNVSGEDWKGVLVGVGASSALSFRYDLWSVRRIDRDLLQGEDRFAVAPPTGMSPYAETGGAEELGSIDSSEVRPSTSSGNNGVGTSFAGSSSTESQYYVDGVNTTGLAFGASSEPAPAFTPTTGGVNGRVTDKKSSTGLAGVTVVATSPTLSSPATAITDDKGNYSFGQLPPGKYLFTFYYGDVTQERSGVDVGAGKVATVAQKLDSGVVGGETIRIQDSAPTIDATSTTQGMTITRDYITNIPVPGRTMESSLGAAAGSSSSAPPPPPPIKVGDDKLAAIAKKITSSKKDVVIEAHGVSPAEVGNRAAAARNKLIDDGVPAKRIHVVPKVGPNESPSMRLVAITPGATDPTAPPTAGARAMTPDTPVGESHFMADRPMDVKNGSSAMVAMVHGETEGGVVYLYDPISERGDKRFAFKAVRLDNPTADTLEPGPVTVYGDGRFIGEGITEPVPPKASVVVPFASDRQIVVEQHGAETDRIAKLVTAQRGIVTAEVQHRRQTRFTITSRLDQPAKVYLRHHLESGWTLVDAPPRSMKVGDSNLFEVDVAPKETAYVTIAESTPIERSLKLSSDEALDMMKVYIDEPEATPELKTQIEALLAIHRGAADLVDKIRTLRTQLDEYRSRAGELHAQLVTLKAVRTGGELMTALKSKLNDMSDRVQKLTIEVVDAEERLMLQRVKFENQLAELHLTDTTKALSRR